MLCSRSLSLSRSRLAPAALLLLLLAGCGEPDAPEVETRPLVVATSFHPPAAFARRIAGELAEVHCLLPAGEDPEHWQPDAETLDAFRRADLVLLNGAGLEPWAATASLPRSRVVELSAPLRSSWIQREERSHRHGDGEEHAHGAVDPHTWLDPENARVQARALSSALERLRPQHAETFRTQLARLEAELEQLAQRWRALSPRLARAAVYCAHPAYDYLGKRYGFQVQDLGLDPDEELEEGDLERIGALLDGRAPRLLLWESEPLLETAETLRERFQIESVLYSPGESPSEEELGAGLDHISIQHDNLERLELALGTG